MQKSSTKYENTIVIIAGPSLTGKSNLASLLTEQGFVQLISSTTRSPREGEIDGVHYHFLSKDEFRRQLSQKKFLEHVDVDARMEEIDGKLVKTEGNFYGMGLDDAHKAFSTGRPVVAVCEPTGVKLFTNALWRKAGILSGFFLTTNRNFWCRDFWSASRAMRKRSPKLMPHG